MKRFVLISLLTLTACATTSGSTSSGGKSAEPQKLAITNVIPFDVASCGPRDIPLSALTAEVLTGAMLSLTPAVQECFVDAQARDGQPFALKAKMTVAETGVSVEVTGAGASAAGKSCIEATFKKLPVQALAAGSKAVVAEIPVAGGPQMVRLGDNAANDIAGKLRLAQPSLCDCYAKIGAAVPPNLKAEVEVAADKAVTISLGATDEVAACISTKMKAIALGDAPAKLTWPLLLKNSYASDVDPTTPAALRFQQLDGMRAQRTADVLVAAGQRAAAAIAFDDLAQKYKKKPAKPMLDAVKSKCAEVASSDDVQAGAVKRLVAVLEQSQKLVAAEKANDPQWAQVEPMLAQQITSSTAEVARVEEQKKNDLNACPKAKY